MDDPTNGAEDGRDSRCDESQDDSKDSSSSQHDFSPSLVSQSISKTEAREKPAFNSGNSAWEIPPAYERTYAKIRPMLLKEDLREFWETRERTAEDRA